jgi:hypothetical protein
VTSAFLDATGLFPDRTIGLPAAFLLKLSAVLQLGMWERQGLREYLSADLPTFAEAAGQLGRRAGLGPAEFDKLDADPLHQRVLGVWIRNVAWEAQDLLGAEVVVGALDDESALVNALAEFAWRHRHELRAGRVV